MAHQSPLAFPDIRTLFDTTDSQMNQQPGLVDSNRILTPALDPAALSSAPPNTVSLTTLHHSSPQQVLAPVTFQPSYSPGMRPRLSPYSRPQSAHSHSRGPPPTYAHQRKIMRTRSANDFSGLSMPETRPVELTSPDTIARPPLGFSPNVGPVAAVALKPPYMIPTFPSPGMPSQIHQASMVPLQSLPQAHPSPSHMVPSTPHSILSGDSPFGDQMTISFPPLESPLIQPAVGGYPSPMAYPHMRPAHLLQAQPVMVSHESLSAVSSSHSNLTSSFTSPSMSGHDPAAFGSDGYASLHDDGLGAGNDDLDLGDDNDFDDDDDDDFPIGTSSSGGSKKSLRKAVHQVSEQRRRLQLRQCFNSLVEIVPLDKVPIERSEKKRTRSLNRIQILHRTLKYIYMLQERRERQEETLSRLRQELQELQEPDSSSG